MACIEHPSEDRSVYARLQRRVFENNKRIAASEFHHRLLEVARPARSATAAPARSLPVTVTPRTLESSIHAPDLVETGKDICITPGGASANSKSRANARAQVWDVFCMFKDQYIANHQLRSGDARNLIIRKVPGLNA